MADYGELELVKGATDIAINMDFRGAAKKLGVTFASSAWTPVDTSIVTASNAALSGNIASADLTALKAGCTLVKITASDSGTVSLPDFIQVTVKDPSSCS